jgi:Cu2+-exporting ATPase
LRLGSASFCGVNETPGETARVYLSDSQGWLASFEVREHLRSEAAAVVAALTQAKVQVHLLSGDHSGAVQRIAAETGIERARGGCSPADKLAALRDLQAQGRKVLMVGDGFNDGPVLAGAHVSVAFGNAVPLAQAQSDFVVLGDNLGTVVHSVLLARKTMAVVRQNLWWSLAYNAACVPLAIAGLLPAWLAGLGMASSSLVVVANALRLTRSGALNKGF